MARSAALKKAQSNDEFLADLRQTGIGKQLEAEKAAQRLAERQELLDRAREIEVERAKRLPLLEEVSFAERDAMLAAEKAFIEARSRAVQAESERASFDNSSAYSVALLHGEVRASANPLILELSSKVLDAIEEARKIGGITDRKSLGWSRTFQEGVEYRTNRKSKLRRVKYLMALLERIRALALAADDSDATVQGVYDGGMASAPSGEDLALDDMRNLRWSDVD